jgi:predicted amidophosphoribosyltransferase
VAGSVESVAKTMSSNTLVPCPDCGHLVSQLAEACPSCARPLRKPAPREGLFLRTMNQLVALGFWGPVIVLTVIFLAVVAGYLSTR